MGQIRVRETDEMGAEAEEQIRNGAWGMEATVNRNRKRKTEDKVKGNDIEELKGQCKCEEKRKAIQKEDE